MERTKEQKQEIADKLRKSVYKVFDGRTLSDVHALGIFVGQQPGAKEVIDRLPTMSELFLVCFGIVTSEYLIEREEREKNGNAN